MLKVLNFQLSAFVNKHLLPKPERITDLMNELTKIIGETMLPNTINSPNLNAETGNIENIPNMAFSTADKKYDIGLILGRIDCNCNFCNAVETDSVKDSLDKCAVILSIILNKYDIQANRLALNINYISEICDGNTRFEKELIKSIPYYADLSFNEWNARFNKRESVKLHGIGEVLNVITDFSRIRNQLNNEIRLVCHNDINTIGENGVYRFDGSSIEEFKETSYKTFNKIGGEIEEWTEC